MPSNAYTRPRGGSSEPKRDGSRLSSEESTGCLKQAKSANKSRLAKPGARPELVPPDEPSKASPSPTKEEGGVREDDQALLRSHGGGGRSRPGNGRRHQAPDALPARRLRNRITHIPRHKRGDKSRHGSCCISATIYNRGAKESTSWPLLLSQNQVCDIHQRRVI